ncbi:Uncharacterised protein [Mycoplasmoides gallisepticum]|nr:Uncharacterised protein [Mycoplasmoides gallisepticum]
MASGAIINGEENIINVVNDCSEQIKSFLEH